MHGPVIESSLEIAKNKAAIDARRNNYKTAWIYQSGGVFMWITGGTPLEHKERLLAGSYLVAVSDVFLGLVIDSFHTSEYAKWTTAKVHDSLLDANGDADEWLADTIIEVLTEKAKKND